MLRIYQLTAVGKRIARGVNNPPKPVYRIISFLDQQGAQSTEQIAEFCGLSVGETSATLRKLKRVKAVSEISGVDVG